MVYVCRLPAQQRPLLNKFYKAQGSAMRAPNAGSCWVARAPHVVAGMSLQPVADGGQWLTGLWVAAEHRGAGVARSVVAHGCDGAGPVWLFCQPGLQGFYERLGFTVALTLPETLQGRLARYSRSKRLVAMCIGVG